MKLASHLMFLILLALASGSASARSVSYSGRLVDSKSRPLAGPVDLEVRFFHQASGGAQVGPTLPFADANLAQGLFQAELSLTPAQEATVFSGASDVWIEVKNVSGNKVYPRQRFTAVPYALRVAVDDQTLEFDNEGELNLKTDNARALNKVLKVTAAGGLTWGDDIVGGIGSVTNTDLAADSVTTDKIANLTIIGSDIAAGTITNDKLASGIDPAKVGVLDGFTQNDAQYIGTDELRARDSGGLKLYDDGGNGLFVEDGGKVGIGTTAPGSALHIQSVGPSGQTFSSNTGLIVENNGSSTGTSAVDIATSVGHVFKVQNSGDVIIGGGGLGNGLSVGYSNIAPDNGAIFQGSVGIGTSAPTGLLHVKGGNVQTDAYVEAGGAQHAILNLKNTVGTWRLLNVSTGRFQIDDGVTQHLVMNSGAMSVGDVADTTPDATLEVINDGSGDSFVVADTNDGDTTPFVITSLGNVGIGTASPNVSLHMHAATGALNQIQITNSDSGSGVNDGVSIGLDGTERAIVWNGENTDMAFFTNAVNRMNIGADGAIGINQSAASTAAVGVTKSYTDPSATSFGLRLSSSANTITADNSQVLAGFSTALRLDQNGFNATAATNALRGFDAAVYGSGATGSITALAGVYSQVGNLGAGTVTTATAFQVPAAQNSGGGTLTTNQGFYVAPQTAGANVYGFRGSVASAASRYNLYMDGTADNYLAGNLGIGTSSPNEALVVAGDIKITGTNALHFSSTSDRSYIHAPASDMLAFATSGVEAVRINTLGNVGVGTTSPSRKFDINDDGLRIRTARTPASSAAACNQGDIAWDANYVYVCVATNTWKRSALTTW